MGAKTEIKSEVPKERTQIIVDLGGLFILLTMILN